jgi:hypothetical protein
MNRSPSPVAGTHSSQVSAERSCRFTFGYQADLWSLRSMQNQTGCFVINSQGYCFPRPWTPDSAFGQKSETQLERQANMSNVWGLPVAIRTECHMYHRTLFQYRSLRWALSSLFSKVYMLPRLEGWLQSGNWVYSFPYVAAIHVCLPQVPFIQPFGSLLNSYCVMLVH